MSKLLIALFCCLSTALTACGEGHQKQKVDGDKQEMITGSFIKGELADSFRIDTATFAAGCFWCVEAQFQQLNGVDTVISGYIGGRKANPTYEQVCSGNTGHAEAVNIIYDASKISYDELLEAFFIAHDPTQLNRQGNDVGTQYRSAIFYHNNAQKEKVNYYIAQLNKEHVFDKDIVTTIEPYGKFYIAEDYHQNYYNLNREAGYCQYVIAPKMEKFNKVFKTKLKNK